MTYSLDQSIQILERTPQVLIGLLGGLDDDWVLNNEGPETFSPYDVLGHLIHGERTDWATRAQLILENEEAVAFEPYDRFAQYQNSQGKTASQLLEEFRVLREKNLDWLRKMEIKEQDLIKKGIHPVFGPVTLRNLLAGWVVHDLTHIAQIGRVMAKQYQEEIGPWTAFFRILSF